MVMVSDLHIGYHNRRAELARWIDLINAEKPDLILVAGDIIDMSMRPIMEEKMAEEFRRLNAPVYACLGNHEYYSNEPRAEQFYRDANIHLLRDTAVWVGNLLIIGRDDRTNRRRKSLAQLVKDVSTMSAEAPAHRSQDPFTILLDHQPYELEKSEQVGIDFQFSGHTHHGQVWPISWITNAVYECSFGEHQRGATRYYVSSGLGIWGGKFRIGTRSEYVVATIEHRPHGTPQ
jgi:predicted MPP superfamily phosphohydrolase